jgi:hypothetical protein
MKKTTLFSLAIWLLAMLPGCIIITDDDLDDLNFANTISGSGRTVSERRTVGFFERVSLQGASQVALVQANDLGVEVQAYENLAPLLETYVENGTLYIRYRPGTRVRNDNSLVRVRVPSLTGIALAGSGNIVGENSFALNRLEASISGSGNISLAGTVRDLSCLVSGSGSFNGFDLLADQATVSIVGSGNVSLSVRNTLDASIAGSGDIIYQGNPTVNSRVSGSGRVRRR